MKHLPIILIIFCQMLLFTPLYAQMVINTRFADPSAALDIATTDKGLLITRVPLTNLFDKITVPNPIKGMIIIALSDSDPSVYGDTESVKKGHLYKFNGNNWDEIVELETPSTGIMFPEIVAYGINNNTIPISNSAFGTFILATKKRYKNYVTLNDNGSITVTKAGYYVWSIQLFINAFGNSTGARLAITKPGGVTYSFKNSISSPTVRAQQPFSISGSVLLASGETSLPFTWELSPKNISGDSITKQTVIWQYIGK